MKEVTLPMLLLSFPSQLIDNTKVVSEQAVDNRINGWLLYPFSGTGYRLSHKKGSTAALKFNGVTMVHQLGCACGQLQGAVRLILTVSCCASIRAGINQIAPAGFTKSKGITKRQRKRPCLRIAFPLINTPLFKRSYSWTPWRPLRFCCWRATFRIFF